MCGFCNACVCVCVGFDNCCCFRNFVFTVFLYCFIYVYLFSLVLSALV